MRAQRQAERTQSEGGGDVAKALIPGHEETMTLSFEALCVCCVCVFVVWKPANTQSEEMH